MRRKAGLRVERPQKNGRMGIRICVAVLLSMSMCLQSRAFSQGQREIVGDGKGRSMSLPVNVVSSVPEAAAYLSGVSELEQIPEEEMEKWWDLAEHPVPINLVGRNVLEASGLMSMYQIVSLLDYRARSGDVLSISELGAVDGFGKETAEALRWFISLESHSLPGKSSDYRAPVRNSLTVNESNKLSIPFDGKSPDYSWSHYEKFRTGAEGRWSAGLSLKRTYSDDVPWPSAYTVHGAYFGRRHLSRLVVGDYSVRFGQGLAMWSGFAMTGVSGPRSFWKRPTGISPSMSASSSSSLRGVAAELDYGRLGISVFLGSPGFRDWCENGSKLRLDLLPGINVSWFSRHGQVSFTALCNLKDIESAGKANAGKEVFRVGDNVVIPLTRVSANARFCVRGIEIFGEAAMDISSVRPALTGGFMFPAGEWKLALVGRYIPSEYDLSFAAPVRAFSGKGGEHGAAAGISFKSYELSVDYAFVPEKDRKQVKVLLSSPLKLSESVNLDLRVTERWKSYGNTNRLDLRADLKVNAGKWDTVVRAYAALTDKLSGLGYVEESYSGRIVAVFLRGTMFAADSWDGRLYCYERDAPGSFNVPAYYGRGYSLSLVARLKFRLGKKDAIKAYIRTGYTDTPWLSPGQTKWRPAKAELKMQVTYDF